MDDFKMWADSSLYTWSQGLAKNIASAQRHLNELEEEWTKLQSEIERREEVASRRKAAKSIQNSEVDIAMNNT